MWSFDCCGVVAAWELKVQANAVVNMQIWKLNTDTFIDGTMLYQHTINGNSFSC